MTELQQILGLEKQAEAETKDSESQETVSFKDMLTEVNQLDSVSGEQMKDLPQEVLLALQNSLPSSRELEKLLEQLESIMKELEMENMELDLEMVADLAEIDREELEVEASFAWLQLFQLFNQLQATDQLEAEFNFQQQEIQQMNEQLEKMALLEANLEILAENNSSLQVDKQLPAENQELLSEIYQILQENKSESLELLQLTELDFLDEVAGEKEMTRFFSADNSEQRLLSSESDQIYDLMEAVSESEELKLDLEQFQNLQSEIKNLLTLNQESNEEITVSPELQQQLQEIAEMEVEKAGELSSVQLEQLEELLSELEGELVSLNKENTVHSQFSDYLQQLAELKKVMENGVSSSHNRMTNMVFSEPETDISPELLLTHQNFSSPGGENSIFSGQQIGNLFSESGQPILNQPGNRTNSLLDDLQQIIGNREGETVLADEKVVKQELMPESFSDYQQQFAKQVERWELAVGQDKAKQRTSHLSGEFNFLSGTEINSEQNNPAADLAQLNQRPQIDSVVEQISRQLAQAQQGEKNSLQLQLEPDFLGKVNLDLEVDAGEVSARFVVNSSRGRDFLEENVSRLRESLQEQGFEVERLDIESDNQEYDQQQNSGFSQWTDGEQNHGDQGNLTDGNYYLYRNSEQISGSQNDDSALVQSHRWLRLNNSFHRMNILA